MNKWAYLLVAAILMISTTVPAFASVHSNNQFSIPKEGTVLQDVPDRDIKPNTPPVRNPIIPGESPTTGLLWQGFYMPILVQYSNSSDTVEINGKKETHAGIGLRAPWGAQYADIIYEAILYRTGETRMTLLFSDSLIDGNPVSAGPVRSARVGHVYLREEWQGGLVFAGGPEVDGNDIQKLLRSLDVYKKGLAFNLETNVPASYSERLQTVGAPENLSVSVFKLMDLIPTDYAAIPHAYLFADQSPYTDGYDLAYQINLDWGAKKYVSRFEYDETDNVYYRYMGNVMFQSFESAENRVSKEKIMYPLTFSNVIVQRVEYEYANGNKIMPLMQSVGKGNADIFIGGRYIAGYWVRNSVEDPTVFYDDQGNEIQLQRGKTFIAQMPPDCLLTFSPTVD